MTIFSGMDISRKQERDREGEVTEAAVMTVKDKRNGSACLLLPANRSHEPDRVGNAPRA